VKINVKKLLFNILLPVVLGSLVGLLTSSFTNYDEIIQPRFAPPGILFPIVWTILYTFMGISIYLVKENNSKNQASIKIYKLQLIVNLLWSFLFFTFRLYLVSFIWIILLIVLVIHMILNFYKISKPAAYIQIPYLIWLFYASILNFQIFLLN